jgi:Xaa-Pro aminopeptidase
MEASFDPWQAVPAEEFRQRQARARAAAAAAGLDGLIVYGKGGAPVDMHAEIQWLTQHYSPVPYVSDHFGFGRARAHAVCLLPLNGPTLLVVDTPHWRADLVVADDVRASPDLTAACGDALLDAGLLGKRVGLVGTSFMSASAYLGLRAVAGDTELVPCDALLEPLRWVKGGAEQQVIRQGVHIASEAMEAMMAAVRPGATEAEAVAAALACLIPAGGVLYDAACASGAKAHQFTPSRMPSYDPTRRLSPGDLFHVDFYGAYGGYLWDFARSRVVGDEPSPAQRELLEAAVSGVEYLAGCIRPGRTAAEIYEEAEHWLAEAPEAAGLPPSLRRSPQLAGHGVGLAWELPVLVPADHTPLEAGMFLAVELFLTAEGHGGALFEHNGFVTQDGFEVLTTCQSRWW